MAEYVKANVIVIHLAGMLLLLLLIHALHIHAGNSGHTFDRFAGYFVVVVVDNFYY